MQSIKQYIPFIFCALVVVAFFVGKGCQPNYSKNSNSSKDSLKAEIKALKAVKSETRTKTDTVEKIRTKYITKYKEVRHDSLIPCPEKLALCDTVVIQDSISISLYKQELAISDSIIHKQDQVIRADSSKISDLTKKVKRQKRFTKFFAGLSVVLGGVAVVR